METSTPSLFLDFLTLTFYIVAMDHPRQDEIRQIWHENGQKWLATRQALKRAGLILSQREVFDIVNDIRDADRVAPCGKPLEFKRWDRGYEFCSNMCECAQASRLIEARKTSQERYGVDNPMQDRGVREQFTKSMIEKHGVAHALQSKDFVGQAVATQRATLDERGSKIVAQRRATCLERFGVENATQSQVVQERIRATNRERYGVDHVLSSPQVRAKITSAFQEAYQRDHHTQRNIPASSIVILEDKDKLGALLERLSLNRVALDLGIDTSTLARYRDNHGIMPSVSSYEVEIGEFLTDHAISYIHNKRGIAGVSLDFFLPEHHLAIEFNGLYWHSSKFRDQHFHRNKYLACKRADVPLVMINEDEWLHRGAAWRSRLINILGMSKKGLPARKLVLRLIDQNTVRDFCDRHHIQGATSTIIYGLGAYHGETLVGVMAFSRQRGTSAVELIRFCTDGDSHAGLFSRMFQRSITDNDWDEVISFADLRHSSGGVYRKNGFELVTEIAPDYRYVVRNQTFHKSTFTKTAIRRRFPDLDPSLTEREAMEQLGIPRIYDCGKLKFRWRRDR